MDLSCSIYIDLSYSYYRSLNYLNDNYTLGKIDIDYTILSTVYDFYLEENKKNNSKNPELLEEEKFLYFDYVLDCTPTERATEEECIDSINNLLEKLWSNSLNAVAACEFEDKLLRKGNYLNTSYGLGVPDDSGIPK